MGLMLFAGVFGDQDALEEGNGLPAASLPLAEVVAHARGDAFSESAGQVVGAVVVQLAAAPAGQQFANKLVVGGRDVAQRNAREGVIDGRGRGLLCIASGIGSAGVG